MRRAGDHRRRRLATPLPSPSPRVHRAGRALAAAGGGPAAFAYLPRLELTHRIVTETLRLRPPAYLLSRITSRDTQLAGQTIPARTPVLYSAYLIHHRPDLYPDPERFDPERWRDDPQALSRPNDALIPFGSAARQCVGNTFALTEVVMALATIASRWRLRRAPDARVRPVLRGTLEPGGLRMVLAPRSR